MPGIPGSPASSPTIPNSQLPASVRRQDASAPIKIGDQILIGADASWRRTDAGNCEFGIVGEDAGLPGMPGIFTYNPEAGNCEFGIVGEDAGHPGKRQNLGYHSCARA